jgi:hypothetical protein
MKKLLDESTDELTCSLLRAGAEHRPSPAAKAQLILALGAGGALGLFSSNAFAWLGTSAGKLTVLSMTLTVVGAVYVGVSSSNEPLSSAPSSSAAPLAVNDTAREVPPGSLQAGSMGSDPVAQAPSSAAPSADTRELENQGAAVGDATEAAPGSGPRGGSEKLATRSSARRQRRPAPEPAEAVTKASDPEVMARARLDAEVQLVDEMRSAAQRDDRAALGRLVRSYETGFPEGQLRQEVAQFASRLERP